MLWNCGTAELRNCGTAELRPLLEVFNLPRLTAFAMRFLALSINTIQFWHFIVLAEL
jgi:hypothetical protein